MSEAQTADPRFYGRRKGKPLKAGRQALLQSLVPKLRIPLPVEPGFDPRALFGHRPEAVWLEIGFGSGEHLAAQAAAHPAVGFIGAEVFLNGVASLARYVEEQGLANVRVYDEDVRSLLPLLADATLARVSLPFPDPWPKTRHAKRRFVNPGNLDTLARLLVDGAEFRVATDHPIYASWALAQVLDHPAFTWKVDGPVDWRTRPDDSIATRYEEKALASGRKPMFLRFFRRPRTA